METLAIGAAAMPVIGLGTWQLEGAACERVIACALELGYRHIDTAERYGNEAAIGRALRASGLARPALFLTTKVWMNNLAGARIGPAVEASLDRLQTDHVDLLLIHWPEPAVPLGETLEAMMRLKEAGRTRAIGVSNFPVRLMREAVETVGAPIACNQIEYHVHLGQAPVLDYARAHGIAVTAYSPLAKGRVREDPVLAGIGRKYGKNPGQVALRWLVQQAGVAAIPKASSPENLAANLALFDFALDAADLAAIAGLDHRRRLTQLPWAPEWDG